MAKDLIIKIEKKSTGVKLLNYLKFELKFSTRLTRRLFSEERILLDNKVPKKNQRLNEGESLVILLNESREQDIEAEDIPINIIYEDEDILIVNKPPYMVVHPTKGHPQGTLSNAIANHFEKTGQSCIVRLVNRLDRDTSGLVICAKSQFAHQAMAKKLEGGEIEKYYIAIVDGKIEGEGVIDLPIDRLHEGTVLRGVVEGGYRSITHYKVLLNSDEASKVLIKLETGRTHQIRVHMNHIGHPVVGDTLYGRESSYIERQALHSYKLIFNRIRDGEHLELIAPLPKDIEELCTKFNI